MISARTLPPAPLSARAEASAAVLTEDAVAVWGGVDIDGNPLVDGAILLLDPPAWEPIPLPPLEPRFDRGVAGVAGSLVVWGGAGTADGAVYDLARGAWRELAAAPLTPRINHTMHSIGATLVVWGGDDGSPAPTGPRPYADGARLKPARDEWSQIAPFPLTPRGFASRVWLGSRLVIWGGVDVVADGAPGRAHARGVPTPVPTPSPTERRDAALYDAVADTWAVLPPPPVSSAPARAVAARDRVLLLGLDATVIEWEPRSGRATHRAPLPLRSAALAEPGFVAAALADRVVVVAPEGGGLAVWSDAEGVWRPETSIETPARAGAAVAAAPGYLVIWGGFARGRGLLSSGTLLSLDR